VRWRRQVAALGGAGAGGRGLRDPVGRRLRRLGSGACDDGRSGPQPRGVDDVGHDDGDVVRTAAAQGQLHQPVARVLRVRDAERLLQRLEPPDRSGEAVGAEQVPVAVTRLAHRQVEVDAVTPVEGPGDEGPLRVGAGLLLADPSFVDELLHEGVVVGDLRQHPAAQQVGPRVADVQHPQARPGEQERGQGGSHAVQRRVAGDHVAQVVVGGQCAAAQDVEQVRGRGVLVQRRERGDRDGAGHLAGRVPAHPVGHGEHPRTGVDRVLVAVAQQAGVRAGGEAQRERHRRSSSTVLPIRICLPIGTGVGRTTFAPDR